MHFKETVHSLSNNIHINGILYRLPHIWFPALQLKGGPAHHPIRMKKQTITNSVSNDAGLTLVHKSCWPTITLRQMMGEVHVSPETLPT